MAISFVNVSTKTTNNLDMVIDKPVDLAIGDVMILHRTQLYQLGIYIRFQLLAILDTINVGWMHNGYCL